MTKTTSKTAVAALGVVGLVAAGFMGFQIGRGKINTTVNSYTQTGNDVGLVTTVDTPEIDIPGVPEVPPVITVPSQTTEGVKLSEFHQIPGEARAYVEIYNGKNAAIDLTDWVILGPAGEVHRLTGTLSPYSFVSENSVSTGAVILLDNRGQLIDADMYQAVSTDQAWADQGNNDWQCTGTPSEAAANIVNTCS